MELETLALKCTEARRPVLSPWLQCHGTALSRASGWGPFDLMQGSLITWMTGCGVHLRSCFQRGVSDGDKYVRMSVVLTPCIKEHCVSLNAPIHTHAT